MNNTNTEKKHSVLLHTALRFAHFFVLSTLMAYLVTQAVVTGNAQIASFVDQMLSGEAVAFQSFIGMLLLLTGLGVGAAFMRAYFGGIFAAKVLNRFKHVAADTLARLEYSFFDREGTGGIINKLISDISETERFFNESLQQLATSVITVVTIFVYMGLSDWRLFLAVLFCYPLLLTAANYIADKLQQLAKARREMLDERTEIAYDSVQGIVVGRSYNLFPVLFRRIDTVIETVFQNEKRRTRISTMSFVLQNIISWVPNLLCYLLALYEVLHGVMSVGDMLAFVILLNRVKEPMGEIPFILNDIKEIGVSMKRLEALCAQPVEQGGTHDYSEHAADSTPAVAFENLTFAYDPAHPVFQGLNLEIQKNQTTALVGGSGEGKTTVFKLLCGFYKPQQGCYRLYGKLFADWSLTAARAQFSLVSQNVFLLPESISDNVAYGCPQATKEAVMNACKCANIHDFIVGLPQGYDTQIGERGVRLSGGERQRISIARAFLKDAPILLLDEATSAVDIGTEQMIEEALVRVCAGKTVLIIAHRLNTVEHADRILVFQNGRIAESGTHAALLAQGGIYADLYGKQQLNPDVPGGDAGEAHGTAGEGVRP